MAEYNRKVTEGKVREEGREEGAEEEKIKIAKEMLKRNMPIDVIAEITELSENQVKELM